MARPTSLTDEVIEQTQNYINNYEQYGDTIPSVVGLCGAINRAKSTIYRWAEEGKGEFSDALKAIKESQERVTLNKAITGEFNATISKLVLANHGYSEKQEVTTREATDPSQMSDEELASIASGRS